MRVLIVSPGGLPVPDVLGGAVQTIITNLIKCNDKNISMTVISPFNELAKDESKKYKNVFFSFIRINKIAIFIDKLIYKFFSLFSNHPQSYGRIFKSLVYIKKIKKIMFNKNYDYVVFEHNLLLLLILKNRKLRLKYANKYFIHIHNKIRTLKLIKREYEQAKKLITVSQYMKDYLVNDSGLQISRDQVVVLLNSVDSRQFRPIDKKQIPDNIKQFFSPNKKNILFAGRINKEKGLDVLLDAYEKLDKNKYNLVIVGSTFYSTKNRDLFYDYLMLRYKHLFENITFTNFIPYQEMQYIYNMADIIVLPSMWDEPAGLAMLEAAKCHKPLITTNSGGIPEYVDSAAIILKRNDEIVSNIVKAIQDVDTFIPNYKKVDKIDISNTYSEFVNILK